MSCTSMPLKSYKQCKHSGWIALQKKVEVFVRAHFMITTDISCTDSWNDQLSHSFNSHSPWTCGNHISAPNLHVEILVSQNIKAFVCSHHISFKLSVTVSQVWVLFHWLVERRGHISVRLHLHPEFIMILSKTIWSPKFFKCECCNVSKAVVPCYSKTDEIGNVRINVCLYYNKSLYQNK